MLASMVNCQAARLICLLWAPPAPTSLSGPCGSATLGGSALIALHFKVMHTPPPGWRAGIILHPTSLPGPYGTGEIGKEAYRFVDWLVSAGQQIWQVLPLVPPEEQFWSPYSGQLRHTQGVCQTGATLVSSEERLLCVSPDTVQGFVFLSCWLDSTSMQV